MTTSTIVPTSSRAARTRHRRSRSFSEPLSPFKLVSDPDQPWRSREAWLALHSRSSSPLLNVRAPSVSGSGRKGRAEETAIFGGSVVRAIADDERSRTPALSTFPSLSAVKHGNEEKHKTSAHGHGQKSLASLRPDRSGKKVGIAPNPYDSRSISKCQEYAPTLQGLLRPLMPDTVCFPMGRTKSSTNLRDEVDFPTPWGRRPLLPTTPPVIPLDSSSRHTTIQANLLPSKLLQGAASLNTYAAQQSPDSSPLQNDHIVNQALKSHGWGRRLASPRS